mmetsp:Transcript_50972/g.160399  ORF Transcript_50972/g.160399 Transcript_50972/m.160399 type:complete len:278 (-) Transcript_50972:233-1066(-)
MRQVEALEADCLVAPRHDVARRGFRRPPRREVAVTPVIAVLIVDDLNLELHRAVRDGPAFQLHVGDRQDEVADGGDPVELQRQHEVLLRHAAHGGLAHLLHLLRFASALGQLLDQVHHRCLEVVHLVHHAVLKLVQAMQLRPAVEAEVEFRDLVQHRHNDECRTSGPQSDDNASVELDPQQVPRLGDLLTGPCVEQANGSVATRPLARPGLSPQADGNCADPAGRTVDGDSRHDIVDVGPLHGNLGSAPAQCADRPHEERGAVAKPDDAGRHGDETT